MTYQLKISEEAKQDISQALKLYNEKQNNLGNEFLYIVEEAVLAILQNPYQFAIVINNVRKHKTSKFQYSVLYVIKEEKVIVFAVFHTSRNPDTWRRRVVDI